MSLRAFHVVFILAAILLLDFFGFWSIRNAGVWTGTASFAASSALVVYLVWFLRKTAQLRRPRGGGDQQG